MSIPIILPTNPSSAFWNQIRANILYVNWYSHYGEQYGDYIKKLKMELPYDSAIPLLGIFKK